MRESRTSGSVGAPGGRLPGATRPPSARSSRSGSSSPSAYALGADAVVRPDLGRFWFLGFGQADEIMAAGEQAARRVLPTCGARSGSGSAGMPLARQPRTSLPGGRGWQVPYEPLRIEFDLDDAPRTGLRRADPPDDWDPGQRT